MLRWGVGSFFDEGGEGQLRRRDPCCWPLVAAVWLAPHHNLCQSNGRLRERGWPSGSGRGGKPEPLTAPKKANSYAVFVAFGPGTCAIFTKACVLRLLLAFFGFRHSGDATHASGRQGVRDAEPNGRFGISTTLDPPVRSGSRDFRRLRP